MSIFRVFLSSRFKGMEAERDIVVTRVFPKFERYCLERGFDFQHIDLRWGLTDEDTEKNRVLTACFDRVSDSNPLVLCLLGKSYGWQPSTTEALPTEGYANQDLVENWVKGNDAPEGQRTGKSATHMEILYAIHENKDLLIFLAEGSAYENLEGISEIRYDDGSSFIEKYEISSINADEYEKMIQSKLEAYFERKFGVCPISSEPRHILEQRIYHKELLSRVTRDDKGVPKLKHIGAVTTLLRSNSPNKPIVLTGAAGCGKSTWVAGLADNLEKQNLKKPVRVFRPEQFSSVGLRDAILKDIDQTSSLSTKAGGLFEDAKRIENISECIIILDGYTVDAQFIYQISPFLRHPKVQIVLVLDGTFLFSLDANFSQQKLGGNLFILDGIQTEEDCREVIEETLKKSGKSISAVSRTLGETTIDRFVKACVEKNTPVCDLQTAFLLLGRFGELNETSCSQDNFVEGHIQRLIEAWDLGYHGIPDEAPLLAAFEDIQTASMIPNFREIAENILAICDVAAGRISMDVVRQVLCKFQPSQNGQTEQKDFDVPVGTVDEQLKWLDAQRQKSQSDNNGKVNEHFYEYINHTIELLPLALPYHFKRSGGNICSYTIGKTIQIDLTEDRKELVFLLASVSIDNLKNYMDDAEFQSCCHTVLNCAKTLFEHDRVGQAFELIADIMDIPGWARGLSVSGSFFKDLLTSYCRECPDFVADFEDGYKSKKEWEDLFYLMQCAEAFLCDESLERLLRSEGVMFSGDTNILIFAEEIAIKFGLSEVSLELEASLDNLLKESEDRFCEDSHMVQYWFQPLFDDFSEKLVHALKKGELSQDEFGEILAADNFVNSHFHHSYLFSTYSDEMALADKGAVLDGISWLPSGDDFTLFFQDWFSVYLKYCNAYFRDWLFQNGLRRSLIIYLNEKGIEAGPLFLSRKCSRFFADYVSMYLLLFAHIEVGFAAKKVLWADLARDQSSDGAEQIGHS